jgi:hypothetical protein
VSRNLLAILLDAYWQTMADDPLAALLATALASLFGVVAALLLAIAVELLGG